jgi:ring-1,2-phenylacetyl-CoA epoxidase subunit PaaC
MIRLGDGTDESHRRAQAALDALWRFTGELFLADPIDDQMVAQRIAPNAAALEPIWRAQVADTLQRATLKLPESGYMQRGGRVGRHTEDLGHLLAAMQILPRSHPGAKW